MIRNINNFIKSNHQIALHYLTYKMIYLNLHLPL